MLLVDRIHCIPKPRHLPDSTPRDILLGVHYFHRKEHIQRASRNKVKPHGDYPTVRIFNDLSAATLRQRKDFSYILEAIRAHGLRNRWDFSTKLLITKDGGIITILTPEDDLQKSKAWGIPPPPIEREIQMGGKLSKGPQPRKNKNIRRTLEGLSKYSEHIHDQMC
ncbi:Hypothetical predicted protein [Pelobates cultripes]|uniref:Uncharacterized protein n=1 Tax=Pelobates cultripes TaxID=61616 RepID=A0AAD1RGA5_PELCU|nr:Hypothetical predicted protein [Pelobates cultripes]